MMLGEVFLERSVTASGEA